jgi:hypothetical protein
MEKEVLDFNKADNYEVSVLSMVLGGEGGESKRRDRVDLNNSISAIHLPAKC